MKQWMTGNEMQTNEKCLSAVHIVQWYMDLDAEDVWLDDIWYESGAILWTNAKYMEFSVRISTHSHSLIGLPVWNCNLCQTLLFIWFYISYILVQFMYLKIKNIYICIASLLWKYPSSAIFIKPHLSPKFTPWRLNREGWWWSSAPWSLCNHSL